MIPFPVIQIAPPESWEKLDRSAGPARERTAGSSSRAPTVWPSSSDGSGSVGKGHPRSQRDPDRRDRPGDGGGGGGAGIRVDLVPEEFVSEGVVKAFAGEDLRGSRVLLPQGGGGARRHPRGARRLGRPVRCRDNLPDRPRRPERLRTGAAVRREQGGCDHLHEPLDGEAISSGSWGLISVSRPGSGSPASGR